MEATRSDLAAQNRLCPVIAYPDRPLDWVGILLNSLEAAEQRLTETDVLNWLEGARLNLVHGMMEHMHEPQMQEAMQRYMTNLAPALGKLREFQAAHNAVQ